jgi:two-component system, chemotaxis family, response regulator Rcp1
MNQGNLVGVLVVEDNIADARLIQEAFKKSEQLRVLKIVQKTRNALAFLRQASLYTEAQRPALILLDWRLPADDSAEFLKAVKRDSLLKVIPVIIFSGMLDKESINEAYQLGASSYIFKPTSLEGFFSVLKAVEEYWCRVVILPQELQE